MGGCFLRGEGEPRLPATGGEPGIVEGGKVGEAHSGVAAEEEGVADVCEARREAGGGEAAQF